MTQKRFTLRMLTLLGLVLSTLILTMTMLEFVDAQDPSLVIVKEADQPVVSGSSVTFTIAITNTGDVTLTHVTVSDALVSDCNRLVGSLPELAPGEGTSYECVRTVVTADFTNSATVTGTDTVSDTVVSSTDEAFVHVINPDIEVGKTAEPTVANVGNTVNYTITVENTGDSDLTGVIVDDDLAECTVSGPDGDDGDLVLETDETWTYTCSVTAGNEDIVNTATASATDEAGGTVTGSAQAEVDVIHPAIEVEKTAERTVANVGDTVNYTITVENTGDSDLTGVIVDDDLAECTVSGPDGDNGDLVLETDETWTYTCSVTAGNEDIVNTATASATDEAGGTVTGSAQAEVDVIHPEIEITKAPDMQTVSRGSPVTFTITVANAGDVSLTTVAVSDAQAPDCARASGTLPDLGLGGSTSYECTLADVTDGFINSATATGRSPVDALVTDSDAAKVKLDETLTCPSDMIAYWKLDEGSGSTYDDFYDGQDGTCAGQCPTPTTGHVNGGQAFDGSSTGIDVPTVPGDDSFDWGPTDSFSIEFWMSRSGTPTGNEVIVGRDDSATALHWWSGIGQWAGNVAAFCLYDTGGVGTCITGETVLAGGDWHHIVAVRDGVADTIRIYVDGEEEASASATYSAGFDSSTAALNVGWLDLSDGYHFRGILDEVALYDSALSVDEIRRHHNEGLAGGWYCQSGTFAPIIVSTPVIEATSGRPYVYDVEAAGNPVPTYTLSILPDGMTVDSVTGLISWVPTVAQEGNHDVEVVASNSEGIGTQDFTITVVEGTLCPADMIAYWRLDEDGGASYDDFYDGHDGVCAEGQDCPVPATGHIDGGQAFSSTTGIDVPAVPGGDSFDWGPTDSFSIEFWMSRSGTPTASEIIVGRDDSATALHWWSGIGHWAGDVAAFCLYDTGGMGTCITGETVLAGGDWHHIVAVRDGVANTIRIYVDGEEEWSASATYSAGFDSSTAALNVGWLDLSDGYHFRGTLDEVALYDRVLSSGEIRHHHDTGEAGPGYCINPDISVAKTADPPVVYRGDTVTYTYSMTNPGDVPLLGMMLTDDKCGSVTFVGGDNGDNELEPGEGWVFRCLTNLDQDTTNTATVTGTHHFPDGSVVYTDTAFVDVISPGIVFEKAADPTTVDAGDTVTYTYTVTNTGDDPLSDMHVSDDKCGAAGFLEGDDNDNYMFDPDEIWKYVCSMSLSATTTNVGTATGIDSAGRPVVATDTATVEVKGTAYIYLPMVLRNH